MKFEMNNSKWEIEEITNDKMKEYADSDLKNTFTHGVTVYSENAIYINEKSPNKKRTLYHELAHCYTYEYGFNPYDKQFSLEDVCEISACSHDIIHNIVEEYFNSKK